MAELTKEYFDQTLDAKFDKMAISIKNGFDGVDDRFDKLETKVDIIQSKLDTILYKEVVQIESRVKKIEQHLGLKAV